MNMTAEKDAAKALAARLHEQVVSHERTIKYAALSPDCTLRV
jgi:hypothetical protein